MNPSAVAAVGEVRQRLQLFDQGFDANSGARLNLADRQASQALELGHQFHAIDQRSLRKRLQQLGSRVAAELGQVGVDDRASADCERRRIAPDLRGIEASHTWCGPPLTIGRRV